MTAVYRGLTRAALDREYSPSLLADDVPGHLQEWARASAAARAALDYRSAMRYGPGERQLLDFFPVGGSRAGPRGAPLLVFIHGGYWIELSKDESAFLAPAFVPRGVAFAAVGYPLAPAADLDEIAESCERAVAFLVEAASAVGVDPARVHLCGLSAGAHLAAMVATGRLSSRIRGLTAVSGVYDLEPIRLSYVGEPLRLDADGVARNSPLYHVRAGLPPLIAAHGDRETREIVRQSWDFAAAWRDAGNDCTLIEVAGTHHFDVIHRCGHPHNPLGRALFAQIWGDQPPPDRVHSEGER